MLDWGHREISALARICPRMRGEGCGDILSALGREKLVSGGPPPPPTGVRRGRSERKELLGWVELHIVKLSMLC